uniref:Uncharacterized protein n=1 Tax=Brassica campestris TaxID=3711 RepID=A0A3P5Y5K3_BRACM|nr:unnamed protein product [Brassica rapa]
MEHEIQRGLTIHKQIVGHVKSVHDYISTRHAFIKDYVKLNSSEDVVLHLVHRPIEAVLASLYFENKNIGDKIIIFFFVFVCEKIYRGPVNLKSTF